MLKYRGRRRAIDNVVFSADGCRLAACGWFGGVHVWDSQSQQLIAHFAIDYCRGEANTLGFIADEQILIPNIYTVGLGDLRTQQLKTVYQQNNQGICPHPNGQSILVTNNRQIKLFDLNDRSAPRWSTRRSSRRPYSRLPVFFPDGSHFVTIDYRVDLHPAHEQVLVIRAASDGEIVHHWPHPAKLVLGIGISADGQRVMTYAQTGVWLWDLTQTPVTPREFSPPTGDKILTCAFHPSGTRFATIGEDRLVNMWDADTLQRRETYQWKIGKINTITFSSDGYRAAVGSSTGTVLVWDVE